jgi:hypothetical protein
MKAIISFSRSGFQFPEFVFPRYLNVIPLNYVTIAIFEGNISSTLCVRELFFITAIVMPYIE